MAGVVPGAVSVEGVAPLGSVEALAEAGAGVAANGGVAHLEDGLGTHKAQPQEEPASAPAADSQSKGRWLHKKKKKGQEGEKAAKEPAAPMVKYWELYRYADSLDWLLMALGSIGAIANGASLPVFFLFFGKMVNTFGSVLDNHELIKQVSKYASYFAYLALVELVACWLQVSCWMTTGERQASRLRIKYLRAILRQDVGYFDTETSTGEIVSRVSSDTILVQEAMSEKVGTYLQFMATFVGGFIVGFSTLWQLSLVILAIVPVLAAAGGIYAIVLTGLVAKGQAAYSGAGSVAEQMVSAVRTVYSFAGEDAALAQYSGALATTLRLGLGQGLAKGLGMGVTFGVLFCAWALQFWVGSLLVIHGKANGGQALTTMFAVILGGLGLGQAAPYLRSFAQGKAAAHKIFETIRRVPPIDSSHEGGLQLPAVRGDIKLDHVDFTYPARPDQPVFRDFSIVIPAGQTVALVGSSGSGKSTIVGLLERFYDPQGGVVSLDGHDLRTLQLRWLRAQLGLVSQEPALFATSIRGNILYGKPDATHEEVEAAARAANAHTFISTLPRGYETQVGERGVQMSGGQKQRIAIARAVIKNPRILLLDEATSALDSESEQLVQAALDRLMVGRTTVVVAHRLSTIRGADSIAVLQAGRIVEQGRHEELLARGEGGAYASLIALQARRAALDDDRPRRLPAPQLSLQRSDLAKSASGLSAVSDGGPDKPGPAAAAAEEAPVARPSYWRLLKLNKPEWKYGVLGTLGAIGAGAVNPVFALLLISVIRSYYLPDHAQLRRDVRTYSLAFVGVGVGTVLVYTCEHFFFGAMGEYLTRRVREAMFAAVLRQEVAWFDRDENSSGAITARLASDATVVRGLVGDRLSLVTQTLALIAISFVIGFILNWRLAFVILATYPLIVGSSICQQLMLKGFAIDAAKNYEQSSQVASEAVGNMRTVAAFSAEDTVLRLFNSHLAGPLQRAFRRGQIAGACFGAGQFALFASFGLALWYAGQLVGQGHGEFGQVLKVFMVMIVSAFAIGEALGLAPEVAKGSSALQSVFGLLDRRPAIDAEDPAGRVLGSITGTIELKHVTFRYPSRPDVTVFADFSLRVPAGSTVALVGQSGSGKSTIVSLIERFYDPEAGAVLIDGHDIRSLQLRALRRQIGLVSQEPTLFATSIRANIAYGREGASEAEIVEAARAANAHTFISGLPDGYDTQVGERGVQMSGGQKQRIAIARAVLKDPRILLLDEATSALDSESEKLVQAALDRLMLRRTTVVVAHRLSTIRNADQIAVLAEGKIVEAGSHDKLIAKGEGGAYWSLVNLQSKA